jgi:hypothetical protein
MSQRVAIKIGSCHMRKLVGSEDTYDDVCMIFKIYWSGLI